MVSWRNPVCIPCFFVGSSLSVHPLLSHPLFPWLVWTCLRTGREQNHRMIMPYILFLSIQRQVSKSFPSAWSRNLKLYPPPFRSPSRQLAESLLMPQPAGTFLVRESETVEGSYSVSVRAESGVRCALFLLLAISWG